MVIWPFIRKLARDIIAPELTAVFRTILEEAETFHKSWRFADITSFPKGVIVALVEDYHAL